ncbi:MAG: hypothetical protein RIG27_03715 [Coleofasciculus sp. F4-SAH-05]
MNRANKRGFLAFCAVLFSILLIGVGSAQAQTPPDTASPVITSKTNSSKETLSSSATPPSLTKETDVSAKKTPSSSPAPLPAQQETDTALCAIS